MQNDHAIAATQDLYVCTYNIRISCFLIIHFITCYHGYTHTHLYYPLRVFLKEYEDTPERAGECFVKHVRTYVGLPVVHPVCNTYMCTV